LGRELIKVYMLRWVLCYLTFEQPHCVLRCLACHTSSDCPRADFKPKEELLNVLLEDFRAVLQHELARGVPKTQKPSLVKPRAAKPGATSLATKLLLRQREKAAAHTRAFWASNPEGAFVAFRKTRTRVPQPKNYIGVKYPQNIRKRRNPRWNHYRAPRRRSAVERQLCRRRSGGPRG
jgi:hypothetical protein